MSPCRHAEKPKSKRRLVSTPLPLTALPAHLMKTTTRSCLALLVALALIALPPFARAEVRARGSDSTLHVLRALATAYEAGGGPKILLEGGGSGAGVKGLLADEVTLAFLSRDLKADELAGGLVAHPYALDGVALVVHPSNSTADLTLAAAKEIFIGQTAAWPDAKPIVVFNRNADSGTREVFQEKVLGKSVFSPRAIVKHDGVLLSSLAKMPGAVAYTSLGEADETKVKILTISGIKPSPATLRDGTYPIGRRPTLASRGAPAGETKAFIDFVLSPKGQAIVTQSGLVTLN